MSLGTRECSFLKWSSTTTQPSFLYSHHKVPSSPNYPMGLWYCDNSETTSFHSHVTIFFLYPGHFRLIDLVLFEEIPFAAYFCLNDAYFTCPNFWAVKCEALLCSTAHTMFSCSLQIQQSSLLLKPVAKAGHCPETRQFGLQDQCWASQTLYTQAPHAPSMVSP